MGRNHPGVWPVGSPAEAAFQLELHTFEHGLPYDPAVIDRAYWGLLNTLVESSNQAGRPVYLTLEVGAEVAPGFVRVPEGLAFRLYREWEVERAPDAVWDDFRYRPFARRSQLADGLVGAYAGMLTNRGLFLERRGRPDAARGYAVRALGVDPAFPAARALAERVAAATVH
jgi:hypothetical protein